MEKPAISQAAIASLLNNADKLFSTSTRIEAGLSSKRHLAYEWYDTWNSP